jgi:hypothetical protein
MAKILSIAKHIKDRAPRQAKISPGVHSSLHTYKVAYTDGSVSLRVLTDGLLALSLQLLSHPVTVTPEVHGVVTDLRSRLDINRGSGRCNDNDPIGA